MVGLEYNAFLADSGFNVPEHGKSVILYQLKTEATCRAYITQNRYFASPTQAEMANEMQKLARVTR